MLLETTARRSSKTRSRQKPDAEVCMVGLPRVRCPQKAGSRRRRYVSVSWGWGGVGAAETGPTTERVEGMSWGDGNAPAPGGGDGCTTS